MLVKIHDKIYGLLIKHEVKMAGYWPSSFCACLWTEAELRSINTQKKTRPISSHLDRTSLANEGFIIWKKKTIFLRGTACTPSGQDSAILLARVANHRAGCTLTEIRHIRESLLTSFFTFFPQEHKTLRREGITLDTNQPIDSRDAHDRP